MVAEFGMIRQTRTFFSNGTNRRPVSRKHEVQDFRFKVLCSRVQKQVSGSELTAQILAFMAEGFRLNDFGV